MATTISVFRSVARADSLYQTGEVFPVALGLLSSTAITPSGSNQATSVLSAGQAVVRVYAAEAIKIAIGPTANATTDAVVVLGAGQFDYFAIAGGDKLAVVTA